MAMISEKEIGKIIDECAAGGQVIKVRDICFILLSKEIDNVDIIYRCLFMDDTTTKPIEYSNSAKMKYLRGVLKGRESVPVEAVPKKNEITFDENKAAMVQLIQDTQRALDNGEIEAKEALKIQADLRCKLNDKFSVNDEMNNNCVVIESKYNHVCEKFGVECYLPTKEQLMKMYNLTEK